MSRVIKTYQKHMVFNHFGPLPPKTLQSECGPRFCSPRPSLGPLQKCIQYHSFDQFGSWVFLDPPKRYRVNASQHMTSQVSPKVLRRPPSEPFLDHPGPSRASWSLGGRQAHFVCDSQNLSKTIGFSHMLPLRYPEGLPRVLGGLPRGTPSVPENRRGTPRVP